MRINEFVLFFKKKKATQKIKMEQIRHYLRLDIHFTKNSPEG